MKQYLLVDLCSDYKKIMSYDDLKELLIEQLEQDTRENHEDYDIVNNNLKCFRKLATNKYPDLNYIKDQLLSFSFKIIDLLDIQRDLEDIKNYYTNSSETNYEEFETILTKINKEVK